MGNFNDDLSLALVKAKISGFLPDVSNSEVPLLRDTATQFFSDDTLLGATGPAYGQKWVFDGDSITIGGVSTGTSGQDRASSWVACMVAKSQGRINLVHNAGLAGQRIDGGVTRFAAEVAAYTPDVVVATFGTNDIGQARTLTQFMSDLEIYYRKTIAINARLVVGTIWPRINSDGFTSTIITWNDRIRQWAKLKGVQVIDWFARFADPFTNSWPVGWSTDGIHPAYAFKSDIIGQYGWDCVKNRVPFATHIARAQAQGTDSLANGFFQTLTTLAAPVLSAGVADSVSGSLPAGIYSYKYTTRTYWGESVPSAERIVTLTATGKITLTNTTIGTARGYRIYRKGPSDTTWKYIAYSSVGTNTSFVDDGSYVAGSEITNIDTSQVITGLTVGTSALKQMPTDNKVIYTEDGILGNILRLMPIENFATVPNEYFPVTVVAGEVWEISGLVRTAGDIIGMLAIRFRDAGSVALTQNYAMRDRMPSGWGFIYNKVTIPTNAVTMRISIEHDTGATVGYAEFAELQCKKLS